MVYSVIFEDLVETMKTKACSINLPKGVNLTLPTSEKSFIGNYPLGTSFDLNDTDNIVGINWKGEDGARDLDLSLISIDGTKYGWNAAYKTDNNSVMYSGDMTSANPEATELFYCAGNFPSSIVKVNAFNAAPNALFKFFFAIEKKEKGFGSNRYGYDHVDKMIDPNNIKFTIDCTMDSSEKSLGVITNDKFILAQFRTGNGRVSRSGSITEEYTDYALKTINCYLSLEELLTTAGFTITDVNPDIDLTNLSKDSLIDLIS
jgi:hypothetical protein